MPEKDIVAIRERRKQISDALHKNLHVKIKESLTSVLPIAAIVLILHFTITPLPLGMLAMFFISTVLLILGMGFFTMGADMAMMPIGESIGGYLTKSRKLWLLVLVGFVLGFFITMAEPDLKVLARQVPAVDDMVLMVCVALGVGFFLVVALLRIVFQKKLSYLLIFFYLILFGLAIFVNENMLPVSFDSGGVTTGPITVPFIMALGIGVAAVRGANSSQEDSFGLVGLGSIGPILAVLILGMFYNASSGGYEEVVIPEIHSVGSLFQAYFSQVPHHIADVAIALAPILLFFILFQIIYLKLPKRQMIKIIVGSLYTYIGLVLFLSSVNFGFLPVGKYVGGQLASLSYHWILIPIGMVIGFFVVAAEPAVHVLNKQVEEITGGTISKKAMLYSLSIGVALALGLSMIRVLTGLSLWYIIVPGYALALTLTFFVPKIFTAVAFDSGGVASGPMTATFILPFAMGACEALGGNVMTDAFGVVALVAMTPLITIQILGLIYNLKMRKQAVEDEEMDAGDEQIIDLQGDETE